MITINLIAADYGDTILIDIEPADEPESRACLLVDCGFNYETCLLPILSNLKKSGKSLDRFIITHYDQDHIEDATTFIQQNGKFTDPQIIPIAQVWLNTFRHLQFEKSLSAELSEMEVARLKTFMLINSNEAGEGTISAKQASLLGKELFKNGYPWNVDVNYGAICVENGPDILINKSTKVILLSPSKNALTRLVKEFKKVLKRFDIPYSEDSLIDDAFELYALSQDKDDVAVEGAAGGLKKITPALIRRLTTNYTYRKDTAPGNGSSIAFILEADGKKILMLADAQAEVIIEQLKELYPEPAKYPIYFDAVKVAHHGSFRNNKPELFELIDSPVFLFSTNGAHPSHEHPDLETIAHIVNRELSHDIKKRRLIFNYKLAHLPGLDNEALMEEFNYSVEVLNEIKI